jgi:hypothetical protein
MKSQKIIPKSVTLLVLIFAICGVQLVQAQLKEPEVRKVDEPLTPLSQGFHNALEFDIMLNNFGFGLGGQYSRVIGPYTELTFQTGITGIRDVTEQNFQDFFTGQRTIPNKFKRALGFPFLLGIEKRVFAEAIDDNFRFFIAGAGGPALAFVYPYINDSDNNGFRTSIIDQRGFIRPVEEVNDFFSGWKDGETEWGFSGELKIGVSLGENLKRQTTFEFGYFFYFFSQGIQIMEPFQPFGFEQCSFDPTLGCPIEVQNGERNPFFDPQKYFGTPQIKIKFGGMW